MPTAGDGYSLEEARKKREEDKLLAAAEAKKRGVRAYVQELRTYAPASLCNYSPLSHAKLFLKYNHLQQILYLNHSGTARKTSKSSACAACSVALRQICDSLQRVCSVGRGQCHGSAA